MKQFKYFNMINFIKISDILTLANAACGLLSIIFAIEQNFRLSALFIFIAMIFDYLDGKAARWLKKQNEFGKQLDSLCDVVSFGIAPAVLGYNYGLNSWYAIIMLIVYMLCGILRLARYNVTSLDHFEGLPITTGAFVVAILSVFVPFNIYTSQILVAYLIASMLMVSSIPVKKI